MVEKKPYADGLNGAVAAVLRGERAMQQLTIEELAERAGITNQSLRRYLATERAIDVEVMYAVAQALGLSGAEVMTRAQERLDTVAVRPARSAGGAGRSAAKKASPRKTSATPRAADNPVTKSPKKLTRGA